MSMSAVRDCIRSLLTHEYEFVQPYQLAELMRQCKEMHLDEIVKPMM